MTRTISVHAEHSYPVVIGHGLIDDCAAYLDRSNYERALIIHSRPVQSYAMRVGKAFIRRGIEVAYFEHPDGEAGKDVDVLARAWDAAGDHRVGRSDLIVGVGGGVTTDLAGFVAASWLRGISVLQVPTTLLGMVDAAVGGKTGINTGHGKNLAGAFHSPVAVVADIDTLATLSEADFNAGLAEVIKCGFISDPSILDLINAHGPVASDDSIVDELVERAVRVKATVVSQDLKESGLRETLNYGHTLAHAIEKLENYQIRHGYAVAIGCVYAAHVAHVLGRCDRECIDKQVRVFNRVGLPVSWTTDNFDHVLDVMKSDKKVRSSAIRMVLVSAPGLARVEKIDEDVLREAARVMGVADVDS
ncbi:MAG: 3-dehydroquinate synthase [Actinomycetaceae bacterium]|nr:3-dehydroquinate synthase [Actinomycetaceae bacterium]